MFNEMFWVATSFVLFVVLARPLWRQIGVSLDEHALTATKNLREAELLRREAQEALETLSKEIKKARSSALAIIEHAQNEASQILAEAAQEVKNLTSKRSAMAMQRIAQYEDSVLSTMKTEIVTMAVHSVEQKLGEGLEKSLQLKIMEGDLSIIKKVVH